MNQIYLLTLSFDTLEHPRHGGPPALRLSAAARCGRKHILPPLPAVMTQSPDADDVGALSGRMAGSDRCLCGLGVPAPRSRSVAEEKGGGPGADSVSADSAEGGQGRGEGGVPGRERLAKTHTLLAFWQGQAAK